MLLSIHTLHSPWNFLLRRAVPKYSVPTFGEALKTNYAVQKVALDHHRGWGPDNWYIGEGGSDQWDPVCRRNIEKIVRLNVAGRGRAVMDPTNNYKRIDVLDQVSDDMDCIFFHLCENPLICGGQPNL